MKGASGGIHAFAGTAPRGARPVDLVFRTVGERTSELALRLAIEHIGPRQVHVIDGVRPFSLAVERMLALDHEAVSHVVHMDADCLIFEDLRPFLDDNELPYVDCFVHDRFRGRIHCGVHVTRTDVLGAMARVKLPEGDLAYVLRPESRLRNAALAELGAEKQFKGFAILHDHFQRWSDVFAKYALRELRSRSAFQRQRLESAMAGWGAEIDHDVARHAIEHARRSVPAGADARVVQAYVTQIPQFAALEVARMGLGTQPPLTRSEVDEAAARLLARQAKPKVFGVGLPRTGGRTLAAALHVLGFDVVHAPSDPASLDAILRGDGDFSLLHHYDGIAGLAAAASFEALDQRYPGAKFVGTVRDEDAWVRSCLAHEADTETSERGPDAARAARALAHLRMEMFGGLAFDPACAVARSRAHRARLERHFQGRPGDLLVLDVTRGEAWATLAGFVGCASPAAPWPHKGRFSAQELAAMEPDD